MFRIAFQFFILALLIVLQYSFGDSIIIFRYFDIMLIAVIFVGAVASAQVGLLTAVVAGLAVDSVSYMPVGFYTVICCLVWLCIYALVKYLFTSLSLVSVMVITILATVAFWVFAFVLSRLLLSLDLVHYVFQLTPAFFIRTLIQIAAQAVIVGVVFFLSSRLSKRFNLSFIEKRSA